METKPLLYGLIGFFLGGLLVAVSATVMNTEDESVSNSSMSSMSMDDMTNYLKDKTGDEFDKSFISGMIAHHEGAVEMAKLADKNAKHEKIKTLSKNIIAAQEKEISEMKQWQMDWGYSMTTDHNSMRH